jgi:hypothetical protein
LRHVTAMFLQRDRSPTRHDGKAWCIGHQTACASRLRVLTVVDTREITQYGPDAILFGREQRGQVLDHEARRFGVSDLCQEVGFARLTLGRHVPAG